MTGTKNCQWIYRIGVDEAEGWEYEIRDLAAVSRTGVAIPPAFVVSFEAYEQFFESRAVAGEINRLVKGLHAKKPEKFAAVAKTLRTHLVKAPFPTDVAVDLKAYFEQLHTQLLHDKERNMRLVFTALCNEEAVLSQSVKTLAEFEKALKQLYSLLFSEHDLYQRSQAGLPLLPSSYSVMVQYLPSPEVSGIAACHDGASHDDLTIQIESWPLERPKQKDLDTQDVFRVDKKSLTLLSRNLKRSWWAHDGSGKFVSPAHTPEATSSLTDEQVLKLARLIRTAQTGFEPTMRFEWVFTNKQFFITRAYRIENRGDCDCCRKSQQVVEVFEQPLLQGVSGAMGMASGPVKLIKSKKDREKLQEGDIAVVDHLVNADADWIHLASGIITESGSHTSLEAKLTKRLLIPSVVGASKALSTLVNNQMVTVDGSHGVVHKGVHKVPQAFASQPVTGTKIWSVVDDPYQTSSEQLHASDGVGLMRGEFIIRMLGLHPHDILRRGFANEYSEILAEGINRVARQIAPHPLIYQLHDVGSANLLGMRPRNHERHEPNPTLGYRGTHKLLSEPELLELELKALTHVTEKGLEHISLMLPMVRNVSEVKKMLKHINASILAKYLPIRLWVKCETPGMLITMEDLVELDIAGVCFDVPALTSLIQGIDKENMQVAHHLDSTDEAVGQALFYAIRTCRAAGVPTMLVAEQDELRPEVVQSAVQAGVTGVAVSPSFQAEMRGFLASVEQRMLLDHLLEEGE